MKRRTKDKVGAWPNMRDDTLRAISDELIRARKKFPDRKKNLILIDHFAEQLSHAFTNHQLGIGQACTIYMTAVTLAAMAIRVLEEGADHFEYSGNTAAPPFKLEPEKYSDL